MGIRDTGKYACMEARREVWKAPQNDQRSYLVASHAFPTSPVGHKLFRLRE